MKVYEKILQVISIVCFGFCLCLLIVSIDMEMDWSIKLWSIVMLFGMVVLVGICVYEFIKETQK